MKMVWKRKQKEDLPWYRSPKYKGDFTEDEKRELDSFRFREKAHNEKHPAASTEDLPKEVLDYISKLECERYDLMQQFLLVACSIISLSGFFMLNHSFGWWTPGEYAPSTELLIGTVFLIAPWIYFPIIYKKINADQSTDEEIRHEWERDYIRDKRKRHS
jgi:hypothetical protein